LTRTITLSLTVGLLPRSRCALNCGRGRPRSQQAIPYNTLATATAPGTESAPADDST